MKHNNEYCKRFCRWIKLYWKDVFAILLGFALIIIIILIYILVKVSPEEENNQIILTLTFIASIIALGSFFTQTIRGNQNSTFQLLDYNIKKVKYIDECFKTYQLLDEILNLIRVDENKSISFQTKNEIEIRFSQMKQNYHMLLPDDQTRITKLENCLFNEELVENEKEDIKTQCDYLKSRIGKIEKEYKKTIKEIHYLLKIA